MSDVDFGLLLGSTNDDIWNEEVDKAPGTRALRKAMTACKNPHCHLTPRTHFQKSFDDPEITADAAKALAAFETEEPEALMDRLVEWGSTRHDLLTSTDDDGGDLGKLFERVMGGRAGPGGMPRMGIVRIGPNGIEGGDDMPPQLRALLDSIFTGDDDDPTFSPPGGVKH